jgi:hypothetical protein
MTFTFACASTRAVVAVGGEAMGPAVTHLDFANYDVSSWGRSNKNITLPMVGSCSSIGTMKSSSLSSKFALAFLVGGSEVDFVVVQRLVNGRFFMPDKARMVVDTGLVEDFLCQADDGGVRDGLAGNVSIFLAGIDTEPKIFKGVIGVDDGAELLAIALNIIRCDDGVGAIEML